MSCHYKLNISLLFEMHVCFAAYLELLFYGDHMFLRCVFTCILFSEFTAIRNNFTEDRMLSRIHYFSCHDYQHLLATIQHLPEFLREHENASMLFDTFYMSHVIKKFCFFFICENKAADQLGGNRAADQHCCFRYRVHPSIFLIRNFKSQDRPY